MSREIKVSVIVPVYNVEKYLEKCLDSLVSQTLKEIEIIVVNDGSPDDSQKIIDQYVTKYPEKIVSLMKENGGLGDARNYGLKYAKGEYIGFVDSDDWIDTKMYETMYQFAASGVHDFVICDFTSIIDGWKTGWHSTGFRGDAPTPNKHDFMTHCFEPATACNKLIHKSLFRFAVFNTGWYEDMATTPVLMSYANKIGYLPSQLYYYRQREGSIIKAKRDMRTLEVIGAWQRAMDLVKEEYSEDVVFAVYKSIVTFIHFKPEFSDEFLDYFNQNQKNFMQNTFVIREIQSSTVEDLRKKKLIPKKIHYFWFGNNPKSDLILRCIESWKRFAPDYEIIEWNETNCNINECKYVHEAYERKKWAFVADYFRVKVIYEQGGIYIDTDMELTNDISSLRLNTAFFGFETWDNVHAGIFGSIAGTKLFQKWLNTYHNDTFVGLDGSLNTSYTIVVRLSKILLKEYGLRLNGQMQILREDVAIYPPNVLIVNVFDGKNIADHHYDASWWDTKEGVTSYKYVVLRDFFLKGTGSGVYTTGDNQWDISELDRARKHIYQLENSTSWKVTKPLRYLVDCLKRLFRR